MPDLISQATICAASAVGRRGKNPLLKIPSKLCNRLAILASLLAASAPVSAEADATAPIKPLISISVQSQAPPGAVMELAQPAIAQEGFTAMLSADAQGFGPLSYQWFLNGDAIDGATNAIHVLQTLERADEGTYSVVVTNAAGQAGSDPTRLLVSNVKPLSYMSLLVNAPTGGVSQIQYADSLGSNALWRPLTGVTSSAAPLVIVDPSATHASQRFYKTPAAQGLKGCLLPGWLYPAPTGSVHTIEFIEPQAGSTNWQTLQTLTIPTSPYLFVDATATNGVPRRYRTTLRASPASRRAGRVVFTVKWILPPDVYTNLVSTNQAALAALGMTLNDQDHALESPINPLPGYWIVVGDQRVMTDTNGGFQVDVPYGTSQGFVVPHSGDRTTPADAIFDVNGLVLPGQTPAPIVVRFERDGSMSMDAAGQSAAAASKAARVPAGAPICGNPCAAMGNRAACCLDYNGIVSDGCRYPDDFGSFGDKLIRYLGSTCHRLVEAGLCVREWNALRFESVAYPPFVVPTAPLNGPSCFENHKYRNCQNIVKGDLSVVASAAGVRCGESIQLTIHNNTWANETELSLGPASLRHPGTFTGPGLSSGSSPGASTLRHYDDAARNHVEDQVIEYTAPTRQEMDSAGDQRIQVTARAGGAEQTIEITVACCGPLTDPSVVPVPNMAYIPAGTFTMGSPASEPARSSSEGPQTQVTISCGFYMGKYEVTQGEYVGVMGNNPSYFTGNLSLPVEQVSWNDAVAYCAALTVRERSAGRLAAGYVYRLPTEAEWEYACRAGTTTPFHYGNELRSGMANFYGQSEYLVGDPYHYNSSGIYLGRTTAVGSYAPNAWGLYDMHGNVWEWCQDWWSSSLPGGSVADPRGPSSGSYRVFRGGSWYNFAFGCRAALRYYGYYPASSGTDLGFRAVLAPGQ